MVRNTFHTPHVAQSQKRAHNLQDHSSLLSHLPKTRQTLLFSATQTQTITSLARLSLKGVVVELPTSGSMKTDSEGGGNDSGRDDGDGEDDKSVENEDGEENEA